MNMRKTKSAFSIIELSVVLAIVAIIISGAVTVSTSALKNAKIKVTKERMVVIQKALETFVHTYKRLPCPANLALTSADPNHGNSICTSTSGTSIGSKSSADVSASTMRYGAVPVRSLGLNIELMVDGFGNKFSYIIPADNSTKSVSNTTLANSPNTGFEGSYFGDVTADNTNIPNVRETLSANSPGTIMNGKVAYVLISHGPNGLGAVNANAVTQNNILGATTDEVSNYWVAAYDNDFVAISRDSGFDDILVYDDRENIIRKIGGFTYTICTTESSGYTGLCTNNTQSISFPPTFSGTTSVTNCALCGAGTATRDCLTNGQWGDIVSETCP